MLRAQARPGYSELHTRASSSSTSFVFFSRAPSRIAACCFAVVQPVFQQLPRGIGHDHPVLAVFIHANLSPVLLPAVCSFLRDGAGSLARRESDIMFP
jgi:hypothetical protein